MLYINRKWGNIANMCYMKNSCEIKIKTLDLKQQMDTTEKKW